jgi:hypothetical protein
MSLATNGSAFSAAGGGHHSVDRAPREAASSLTSSPSPPTCIVSWPDEGFREVEVTLAPWTIAKL